MFYQGDAENLHGIQDLANVKFEMVLNVESSHCYGNFRVAFFLEEVILRLIMYRFVWFRNSLRRCLRY